ncbi:hypothetical protein LA080_009702 [Diaporthe eres]|nr:hypothetical protein LA080_009702 [Diaporthe eres]
MSSPLRNPAKAGLLAGEHGTNMDVLPFDTTSKESIDACLETVMQKTGGKLYILVNNAGFGTTMPLLHASIEAAKAIYDVNVWGTLSLAQALSPLLLKSKGVIMNICSVVGAANVAWQGIYNSSKAAETMISESLRIELEPLGIRVMTVMLGQVSTQMHYYKLEWGRDLNHNESAEVVARNLVTDTTSGRRGQIWRGGVARMVYLALWLLPTRLFEWIVHRHRGVYDL